MSETLIFLLGEKTSDPIRWGLVGPEGLRATDVVNQLDTFDPVRAKVATADTIIGVLPGEQVAMRLLASPPRSPSKFKAAAMYLLEDDLAEPLDDLHIAVARQDGVGVAMAVKKTVMNDWHAAFAKIGVQPDVVAADFSLLSSESHKNVVVFDQNRIMCAIDGTAFSAARPMADSLFAELIISDSVDEVLAYGDAQKETHDLPEKALSWRGAFDDAAMFAVYASNAAQNGAPNLLQGAYKKRWDWRGGISPWRRAATLAAACLVGVIGLTIADGNRSARLADGLNQQTLAVHRTAFPEAANIDARRHARQMLSTQSVGPGFLSLTSEFAIAINDDEQIQIDRIRYNAARGEFSVNLSFADINALETLKSKLTDRGISVSEAGGVRRSGSLYIGELQVSAS